MIQPTALSLAPMLPRTATRETRTHIPVSYTHLDVYKRQDGERHGARLFADLAHFIQDGKAVFNDLLHMALFLSLIHI